MRRLALAGGLALLLGAAPGAGFERPGPRDKCPVCGMFVARYPDWTAAVVFRDGATVWFDGAKDLFRFLQDPGQYLPRRPAAEVDRILVTDYYAVEALDARQAFFVVGSDVHGPMGRELVPFARRSDAEEFRRDHHGEGILRFGEVSREMLAGLE